MSNADVIIEILEQEGVEYLLGFPNNRLFNSAASHSIRPIIARTERVAINMADAYTRMNNGRKIGVVAVQDGPGIEASFPAVAQAYGDNTPILMLPGAHAPLMQDYDPQFIASRSFRDITKMAGLINDGRSIPRKFEMAFAALKNGKSGPVLLETAANLLWGQSEGESGSLYKSPGRYRSMAEESDVAQVLEALLQAKRPVLIAGHGVLYAQAWQELRELAELLQIPVTTTLLGKSAFPETHELSLGTAGRTITKAAAHFANESDFILGIGTSFTINDFTARMPKDAVLGQITNATADIAKCRPVTCAAIGDAGLVLKQLISLAKQKLGESGRARSDDMIAEIDQLKTDFFNDWSERLLCDDAGAISPYRVIHEMNTLFDKTKSVVTHDAGNPRDQIVPFYQAVTPRGYLGWGKSTHLGSSLGMAMGSKLARPDWLSVNFIGDAGFGQTANDFETAVRSKLPIMTVLVNNGVMGGYGAYMPDAVERFQSSSLGGDYTAMAIAMGGYAERIEQASDVSAALRRGIDQTQAGRPVLLEFITKEEPVLAMANQWGM
ncbi:MAG: thiamine pyrophosphate-requiring protein [Gammaproteobacteria bacterium]|jgi:acetolactate synthase I/II/III large subunit|nr:thiamine pyrophosphate-requiring protein [Gammaproteobacteria bacterium]MBT5201995.1 thiamine pyrophosphate-requiring protein [Gammaproteobacteria bacterium]